MAIRIEEPTERELRFVADLRDAVELWVESRGWDLEVLAEKLGLFPQGVTVLRQRDWTLQVAFRIADLLEVPVEWSISRAYGDQ